MTASVSRSSSMPVIDRKSRQFAWIGLAVDSSGGPGVSCPLLLEGCHNSHGRPRCMIPSIYLWDARLVRTTVKGVFRSNQAVLVRQVFLVPVRAVAEFRRLRRPLGRIRPLRFKGECAVEDTPFPVSPLQLVDVAYTDDVVGRRLVAIRSRPVEGACIVLGRGHVPV